MRIEAPVAFVTGANRSHDLAFVKEFARAGSEKDLWRRRNPEGIELPSVILRYRHERRTG